MTSLKKDLAEKSIFQSKSDIKYVLQQSITAITVDSTTSESTTELLKSVLNPKIIANLAVTDGYTNPLAVIPLLKNRVEFFR